MIGLLLLAATPLSAADGVIRGTIVNPKDVKIVSVIDRETGKLTKAGFDAASGRFEALGLPLARSEKDREENPILKGGSFDVIIDYADGRLEGVNLKCRRSDYEEEQPLTAEERKKLVQITRDLSKFEDEFDFLAVEGNIQYAAVLVSKFRTKAFFNSKPGEVVWRVELWHYERPEESWVKDQDELAVVHYRERLQRADLDKKSIVFDPALGGLQLTKAKPLIDAGKIELPAGKPGIRLRPAPIK